MEQIWESVLVLDIVNQVNIDTIGVYRTYRGGHNMKWSQYELWFWSVKYLSYRPKANISNVTDLFMLR